MKDMAAIEIKEPQEQENFEEEISPASMLFTLSLLILSLLMSSYFLFETTVREGDIDLKTTLQEFSQTTPNIIIDIQKEKHHKGDKNIELTVIEKEVQPEVQKPAAKENTPFNLFNKRKIHWPRLIVTGFGSTKGGDGGFAIINNQQVMLNNSVDNVKLVEVRSHDIVVEYQGERKVLTSAP